MELHTYGTMAVDWEERVRSTPPRRAPRPGQGAAGESELGALLCFDMANIRYITATHIGTWAIDKLTRFWLLPQGDEPIIWDFGSAARHHDLYCPGSRRALARRHLHPARRDGARVRPGEDVAQKIRVELEEHGLRDEPLGVDVVELPSCSRSRQQGIEVVDGQQLMQEARMIKTQDEITLLDTACMMVDAAYEELYGRCGRG